MSEPTPQARLIALAATWRKQSEEGRQPTRRKGVKVLGIAGVVRNKCADELEAVAALLPQPAERPQWEGDLPTAHLNRCKLRDKLLYADIFNDDGSHRAVWRCHKREGHEGPCSSHNDCGVMNGGVVCGHLPGHAGPHAWETRITLPAALASPQVEPRQRTDQENHEDVHTRSDHPAAKADAPTADDARSLS